MGVGRVHHSTFALESRLLHYFNIAALFISFLAINFPCEPACGGCDVIGQHLQDSLAVCRNRFTARSFSRRQCTGNYCGRISGSSCCRDSGGTIGYIASVEGRALNAGNRRRCCSSRHVLDCDNPRGMKGRGTAQCLQPWQRSYFRGERTATPAVKHA